MNAYTTNPHPTNHAARYASAALLLLPLLACEPDQRPPLDGTSGGAGCVPGDVRGCTCADGRPGTATCNDDRRTYGDCFCYDPRRPPPNDGGAMGARDAWRAPPDDPRPDPDPDPGDDPDGFFPPPDAALPSGQCPSPPEAVALPGFSIFRYEASHPAANAERAFPGAQSHGAGPSAPPGEPEACSRPGVRPWHTVSWAEARDACARIGWRLCSGPELRRACGGPEGWPWTFGPQFVAGACNLREAFAAAGGGFASEAPAGAFARCVSVEGAFDLTGNVWEWTDQPNIYQGAGWRTVAERHRDGDLVCGAQTVVRDTPDYANADVGFRCCRGGP